MALNTDENWHLDKKVPLGLILAMIVQVIVITVYIGDIKKDVEVLKAYNTAQHERDIQQDMAQARQLLVVTNWLERMDGKLDRIIEKNH